MVSHTTLSSPDADQGMSLEVGSGTSLSFDFDRNDATINRVGQDLILTIHDAVELTLEGFFNNFSDKTTHPFAAIRDVLFEGHA